MNRLQKMRGVGKLSNIGREALRLDEIFGELCNLYKDRKVLG